MLRRVFSLAFTAALAAGTAAAQQPTSSATTTRAKGSPSAPVTVYEMSDFQCPYCRRFALETFPAIEKEYITPGKVRWVFVNYPLTSIHANAVAAAATAVCASRQGAFWPYHDLVFANQDALTDPDLVGYADSLGLDAAAFERALAEGTHQARMQWDMTEGMARGVTGTPTYFLNGFPLQGVPRIWVLELALDAFRRGLVKPADTGGP